MATYDVVCKCSALMILSCLVSVSVLMQTAQASPSCSSIPTGKDPRFVVARDVITLSVYEVQEMKKFVNSIHQMKSLRGSITSSEIFTCADGLIVDLTEVRTILQNLRHLKASSLSENAYCLKNKVDNTLTLGTTCSTSSMKDLGNIFKSMFSRKISDLALIVNEVLYRVSVLDPKIPQLKLQEIASGH